MNNLFDHHCPTPGDEDADLGARMGVVILYDTKVSARRAAGVITVVAETLGKGADVSCLSRPFAELEQAAVWRETLGQLTSSHLLVVATCRDDELPEPVRNLLVSWSVHGPAPEAMMVGLIESECGAGELPPGVWWYLDLISRQAGVPLLVRAFQPASSDSASVTSEPLDGSQFERQSA